MKTLRVFIISLLWATLWRRIFYWSECFTEATIFAIIITALFSTLFIRCVFPNIDFHYPNIGKDKKSL